MKRKYGKVGEFLLKDLRPELEGRPLFENQAELVRLLSALPAKDFSYSDIKSGVSKIVLGKLIPSPAFLRGIQGAIREKLKSDTDLAETFEGKLFTLVHGLRYGTRAPAKPEIAAAKNEMLVPRTLLPTAKTVIRALGFDDPIIKALVTEATRKAVLPVVKQNVRLNSPDEASRNLRVAAFELALNVLKLHN